MGGGVASGSIARALRKVVAPARVLDTLEDRIVYAYDGTTQKSLPDVVVRAQTVEEVAAVLRFASRQGVPVVPRGGGTGLSGGAVPVEGGISLVLTAMRSVRDVDKRNMVAVTQPGVITGELQRTVEREGLFYPPDPASLAFCTIGGNLAENAGGPRGIKYGVTKDYVLGLEVVLPSGEIARLGGRQIKNVTGYNLAQLFVGSEGTLGVITEAILRLLPRPRAVKTMSAVFQDLNQAADTVAAIIGSGIVPATLEIMDQKSVGYVEDYLHLGLSREAEAMLLIEVDGTPRAVEEEADAVGRICREKGASFAAAKDPTEAGNLWKARRAVSAAISRVRPSKIGEDICVPRSALPAAVRAIQDIGRRFELPICIFGHAGDGNLHPNILTDRRDPVEMERVEQAIRAIFEAAVGLGGTLSGEHGVGISKKPYLTIDLPAETIELMRTVKKALDPRGIMNPGKIFGGEAS